MAVNLNHIPTHSPLVHRINWGLQEPLSLCRLTLLLSCLPLAPEETLAAKVGEVFTRIIKILLSIVFLIPSLLFAGIGAFTGFLCDTPSICRRSLHLAPQPITLEDKSYDLSILKQWFNDCGLTENRTEFFEMIDNITKKNPDILNQWNLPVSFYNKISPYLCNIIERLTTKNLSERKSVLQELAHASVVCALTWFEVSKNQLLFLTPRETEQTLLRWVLELKESLILEISQNYEWHILNYVRWRAGNALGLTKEGAELDCHSFPREDGFPPWFVTFFFRSIYHVDDLIDFILTRVNQEYREEFFNFLKTAMNNRGMEDEEAGQYVFNHFYQNDDERGVIMNLNGAIMMLRTIGLIT